MKLSSTCPSPFRSANSSLISLKPSRASLAPPYTHLAPQTLCAFLCPLPNYMPSCLWPPGLCALLFSLPGMNLTLHLAVTGLGSFIFPACTLWPASPPRQLKLDGLLLGFPAPLLSRSEHTSHSLPAGSLSSLPPPQQLEDQDLIVFIFLIA